MPSPLIIGVSGKARAGKDTIAVYLMHEHGFHREPFAAKLKEICNDLFDMHELNKATRVPGTGMTKRQILQVVGSNMRAIKSDVWVQYTLNRVIRSGVNTVIPDVRYPNEFQAIRERGGKMVRVIRTDGATNLSKKEQSHASEVAMDSIDDSEFDLVVRAQSGDIEKIYSEVGRYMEVLWQKTQ